MFNVLKIGVKKHCIRACKHVVNFSSGLGRLNCCYWCLVFILFVWHACFFAATCLCEFLWYLCKQLWMSKISHGPLRWYNIYNWSCGYTFFCLYILWFVRSMRTRRFPRVVLVTKNMYNCDFWLKCTPRQFSLWEMVGALWVRLCSPWPDSAVKHTHSFLHDLARSIVRKHFHNFARIVNRCLHD